MSDLEKAARMALEALGYYEVAGLATTRVAKSITALRQALDQPKQRWAVFCARCRKEWSVPYEHPGKSVCKECATHLLQALEQPAQQQEPVCEKDPRGCWSVQCQLGKVCKNTSSQRKPWVSLTDKEITRMAAPWFLSMYWPLCKTFARDIEAKLKEKNT